MDSCGDITALLKRFRTGDAEPHSKLVGADYHDQLRIIAARLHVAQRARPYAPGQRASERSLAPADKRSSRRLAGSHALIRGGGRYDAAHSGEPRAATSGKQVRRHPSALVGREPRLLRTRSLQLHGAGEADRYPTSA